MLQHFTLEKANEALKFVEPVVTDIVKKRQKAAALTNEAKALRYSELVSEEDLHKKLDAAEKLLDEIEYHIGEIEKIGCFLKDLDLGLVDFPSTQQGKTILLCWKLGEKQVSYWHDTKTGFQGRRQIDVTSPSSLSSPGH